MEMLRDRTYHWVIPSDRWECKKWRKRGGDELQTARGRNTGYIFR